jgi:penicillin-binding protein 1C
MQLYDRQNGGYFPPLPPWSASCGEDGGSGPEQNMEWVYPERYEVVKRPRDLDGKRQSIVLEVAHARPEARLFWHDNGLYLGETEGYHVQEVQFTPGIHKVKVVDDQGGTLSATLKVVE